MSSDTSLGGRRAGWRKRLGNPYGFLFIAPALLIYLTFNTWTLFRGLLMAFTNYQFVVPGTAWAFNGLSNFEELIHDPNFWGSLWVSVKWTLITVPSILVLSVLIGFGISRVRRGAAFYRCIIYLPAILPAAVTYLTFQQMYDPKYGFVNNLLESWGWSNPPQWLVTPAFALPSLAVPFIWIGTGLPTLLVLIRLYSIDKEVYEAATIDGANAARQLWHITIPLLRGTFMIILVLGLGMSLAVTNPMLLTTGGAPENSTRSLGLYLYQVAFQFGNLRLGYAAAMNLVLGCISAAVTLILFRVLRTEAS